MKRSTQIVFIVLGVLLVVSVVGGLGTIVGVFWWYGRGVAELDEARLKNYAPPQVTRVFARDGELIGELYRQRRTLVGYEDVPSHVENAFLAAEDADFYRHEGMDYAGMVRALIANVKAGRVRQGASTITQQVVKIFMLSPERSFERKVQELILARRLERAFTKQEILELYLNEIYLGHGRYGIEEAARFYFGKGVADIDLGQAALLATLPKAPGRDSPLQHPERAKDRQRYVLRQMVAHGFSTQAEIDPYFDAPLRLASGDERAQPVAGAEEFVDEVERQLVEHYGRDGLERLGGEVFTTVGLPLQEKARDAAIAGLQAVDRRNGYAHRSQPASERERETWSREIASRAVQAGARARVVVVAPHETLPADCVAARWGDTQVAIRVPPGSRYADPDLSPAQQFPVDALLPVEITALAGDAPGLPAGWAEARIVAGPEAAVVVIDVGSGEVIAMIGGTRYHRAGFNRALQAHRQPGSAFKPFVYGAALQSRAFTAASLVSDSPEIYEKWRPTNFETDKYLGDVRMRVALAKSINTVAIKLLDHVGVDVVRAFATSAGIESELPANLSLALGTGEITPFELTRAYLTLARGGLRIEPKFIREVRAPGEAPWVPPVSEQPRLPEDVAFVLTSMMQSVVEEGTGTRAQELGRPVAAKTGTSADFHDAWFAGFTPDKVGVVWVGFDKPRKLGKNETGGKAAAPIWVDVMGAAVEGPPSQTFVPPASVTVRRIDGASGLLAPTGDALEGYTGRAIDEFFLAGTEPVDEATPAALPATDVLLDLYQERPVHTEDTFAPEPETQAAVVPETFPLPSLDED